MKKIKLFLISLLLILNSGCFNSRELDKLSIVSAISIDLKDNEYEVSVQIINPKSKEESASTKSSTTILTGTGKTIKSALNNLNKDNSLYLYLSHLNLVVVGYDIALQGLENIMDYFIRDPISKKDFLLVVAKDNKASDIIKINTTQDIVPSLKLKKSLILNGENSTNIYPINFIKLMEATFQPEIGYVLPTLSIEGEITEGEDNTNLEKTDEPSKVIISSPAVFNNDNQIVTFLSNHDALITNILTSQAQIGYIDFKCDNNSYLNVELFKANPEYETSIENNVPTLKINLTGRLYVNEENCQLKSTGEEIEKLGIKINNQIKEMTTSTIKLSQDYKTDFLGFAVLFQRKHSNYFKSVEDEWNNNILPNIIVDVESNLKIIRRGVVDKSIKELLYETK